MFLHAFWRFLPAALVLASCSPPNRVEVVKSRALFRDEPEPPVSVADQQRFAENMAQQLLTWKTPEGWRFVAATEFRHINFIFGPSGEGECYLSLISGAGAGVLDNFNRWCKQIGHPDMTQADVDALPVKSVLQRPAPTIDLTGTYSAGSGPAMQSTGQPKPGWRLVGTIFEAPGALFTIKMTGPKDIVAQNLKAYDAFLSSLAPAASPDVR